MAGDLTGGRPGPDAGGAAEVIAVKMVRGVTVETWRFPGSRGDEVHADAYLAAQPGPVVIGGHGKDGDRTAQYLRGPALQWVGRGVSLVSADAPLHGDRAGEAAYLFAREGSHVKARFFAAGLGVPEDPATGSAAAALAAVLAFEGEPQGRLSIDQGDEIGHPSTIELAWNPAAASLGGTVRADVEQWLET